ncbi:hypothetical protein E1B28_004123 [Marasmius oreades]|uniref:NAD(P)-binding protein n=1 Tax=Marasmius oreades TaxID=181124 RepID=A0A9P7UXX6_9AGAR|nr:uncharacterized protein E1B28_004123 [Marasmius oreades]KAG7096709.1 hypothetical protein E1B28_004123 [Marasmius oreades]
MSSINDSRCVLVTGATSGIGRALAIAISELPSHPKVIGTGRRPDRLKELETAGLEVISLDLDVDAKSLTRNVRGIIQKYPDLDTIILNAGFQREFDFLNNDVDIDSTSHDSPTLNDKVHRNLFAVLYREAQLNYLSVMAFIVATLPHFKELAAAGRPCMVVNVTSGLCVVPATHLSNYTASKAALHSMTMSLQSQFQGTNIHFIEVVPPLVESELHDFEGTTERLSNFWMPLDQYIPLTLKGLQKGEPHVSCGAAAFAFEKFEKKKYELAIKKALPTAPTPDFKPVTRGQWFLSETSLKGGWGWKK